ncbi:MAG: L,D-transpeptidase family protein [Acidobacteria bacterium]|nr:L,D-transpeptidase family protein [Acidobacteriota bacterium]
MRLIAVVVGAALVAAACGGAEKGRQMDVALRSVLENQKRPGFVTADVEGTALWAQTREFYEQREFAPAWIENAAPRSQMDDLIKALHEADREGLDPELYHAGLIRDKRQEASRGFLTNQGFDPDEAGRLDVWLTYLYLKYAADLADGLSDLAAADRNWHIKQEEFDPLEHLKDALDRNRVAGSLADLLPEHREYSALRDALSGYRKIADAGGWPEVPRSLRIKPGQKHAGVPALMRRLAASGDYKGRVPAEDAEGEDDTPVEYGEDLQKAVQRFQARHGLAAAGLVGAETVAALNVSAEARVRQIELNLERWRWLPRDLGEHYILVNVPEMRLRVYENGRIPLAMNVVVGTRETQTPIFNDEMSYLVFSPYWNVPDSIAQGETFPGMMRDPAYLARNNMEILDRSGNTVEPANMDMEALDNYRFRQRPGSANSLGLVKFMFPNQFNVYLHDTPAESLFTRANRAFSHGCVRVANPVALAEYVLRDQREWTPDAIKTAMDSGTEKNVKLTERLPVYLGYWTASVDEDGVLHFRPDIYGIDADQRKRLTERMNRMKKTDTPTVPVAETP